MTDVNINEYQSVSSHIGDEPNSSFILNQSNIPMDIDDNDEIITTNAKFNGHCLPTIENENTIEEKKEDSFHQGNPVLNKSFDVLPQIKDDGIHLADSISDSSIKNTSVLDTTVELPNNSEELSEKPSHDSKPMDERTLLSNQFSLEYPYVIPQPAENLEPSSPLSSINSMEKVTTLTKTMTLNVNKSFEDQDFSTPTLVNEQKFDTNTFVLKKKERRKMTTPATENSLNTTKNDTPSSAELRNKQSPFNTPSTSLDTVAASRSTTSQPVIDPTRIM